MSSFYGNGAGGVSAKEVDEKIEISSEELKNHIIISKTEPTVQKAGDIWFVIVGDNENNG